MTDIQKKTVKITENFGLQGKLSGLKNIPILPDSFPAIGPKRLDKLEVTLYWLHSDDTDMNVNNKLLIYYLSKFYAAEGERNPLPVENLAAVLGILGSLLDPINMLHVRSLRNIFNKSRYDLDIRIINSQDVDLLVGEDDQYHVLLELIGDFPHRFGERDLFVVLSSVILLSIGKQSTQKGFTKWFTNRVSGSIGYDHAKEVPSAKCCPDLAIYNSCHSFASANLELRKHIFLIYVSAAKCPDRVCRVFDDIVKLLKCTEMNHIVIIDTYLYSKYPELLSIRCLADERSTMNEAWRYLSNIPEAERPFVKLLRDRKKTAVLIRTNFELYTAAALACAQYEKASMKNFRISG